MIIHRELLSRLIVFPKRRVSILGEALSHGLALLMREEHIYAKKRRAKEKKRGKKERKRAKEKEEQRQGREEIEKSI